MAQSPSRLHIGKCIYFPMLYAFILYPEPVVTRMELNLDVDDDMGQINIRHPREHNSIEQTQSLDLNDDEKMEQSEPERPYGEELEQNDTERNSILVIPNNRSQHSSPLSKLPDNQAEVSVAHSMPQAKRTNLSEFDSEEQANWGSGTTVAVR